MIDELMTGREKVRSSSNASCNELFPDILHILLFRYQRARARAGPGAKDPRRQQSSAAEETRDARRDRQPIRPRTRGLSRWHQKSEYETRRKLHDVIIVLWECLEWSEYHNTPVLHTMGTIVTDFTVYYCSCPAVNSHVAFTCPRGAELLRVSHSVGTPRSVPRPRGAHIRSFSSPVVGALSSGPLTSRARIFRFPAVPYVKRRTRRDVEREKRRGKKQGENHSTLNVYVSVKRRRQLACIMGRKEGVLNIIETA